MSKNEEPLTAEAVHERIIKYCQGRMCLTCKYSKLPGRFECPIHFIFDNYNVTKKKRKGDKIYIVTCGEYSDYHICCVFSSLDKAEKYCARQNAKSPYEDYFVEEYNVDNIKVAEDIKLYYEYRFHHSGSQDNRLPIITSKKPLHTVTQINKYCYGVTLQERNPEKAKKIISDYLAQENAEKTGL